MTSAQIKKQASYLCLVLLLAVACKSKNPPTFDIVNSDAVRDKVEKDDIDGAIADLERQVGILTALMSNQPDTTQPTTDNNAQMLEQVQMVIALLEIVKAQSGSDAQNSQIQALEEKIAKMKEKLEEKEPEKPQTSEKEENTEEPEEEEGKTEKTETTAKPGIYLYLNAEKGAMVFKISEGGETKGLTSYGALIADGDHKFNLIGYGGEDGVAFPETVAVKTNSSELDVNEDDVNAKEILKLDAYDSEKDTSINTEEDAIKLDTEEETE